MDIDGDIPSFGGLPIKPIIIAIFITIFGGLGVMQTKLGKTALYVFLFSFIIAIIVSFLVNKFIINALKKAQNTSSVSQKKLIGRSAKVIGTIIENGFGQIKYTINGNTYNAPAKHIEGKKIKSGSEVIIVLIQDNVFYVDAIKEN
ncbi:NfeD family protein [Tepidibacter formicigenes]|uniref:Membrane protein implicated in regulation of membrane protease activity n=1 Tax=Tepidibacter formicigenes DSM 15518 TaxID=1123349 RepID=A0A1M6K303_9FIRM|nr:NfeD family protein [Tepidibacter formicigenes]SHJ53341.1 Membrane protein implicated in regulation of membrane protease activity [Tepidibacter formicigenes DSM 15518]